MTVLKNINNISQTLFLPRSAFFVNKYGGLRFIELKHVSSVNSSISKFVG